MKTLIVTSVVMLFILIYASSSTSAYDVKHNVLNQSPMDQKTAIAIAEAVAVQYYGESVLTQRPFEAHLTETTWTVEGVLGHDKIGGVVHVELDAKNYCVTRLTHFK